MTGRPLSLTERRRVILLLSCAGLASNANLRMLDSALPQIAQDFSVTAGQVGQLASAYLLAYGACQLPFGIVGDRRGKYRLIALFCFLCFAATMAGALAGSFGQLWLLRLLAGAVAAAVIPMSVSWMGDNVPIDQRQAVLAGYMAGTLTGMVLGQIGGGFLAEWVSWRLAPAMVALIYLAVGIGMTAYARRVPAVHGNGGEPPRPPMPVGTAFRTVFSGLTRRMLLLAGSVQGMTVFAIVPFSGLLLVQRFGIDLAQTGFILATYALGGFVHTLVIRGLLRRFGAPAQYLIAAVVTVAGMLILGLAPWLWLTPLGAILLGLGGSGMHNNLQTHATQILPESRATGFSIFTTLFFMSQSVGAAICGLLTDRIGIVAAYLAPAPAILILGLWFAAMSRRHRL